MMAPNTAPLAPPMAASFAALLHPFFFSGTVVEAVLPSPLPLLPVPVDVHAPVSPALVCVVFELVVAVVFTCGWVITGWVWTGFACLTFWCLTAGGVLSK